MVKSLSFRKKITIRLALALGIVFVLSVIGTVAAQTETPFATNVNQPNTSPYASPNSSNSFASPGNVGVPHPSPTVPELNVGIVIITLFAAAAVSGAIAKYKMKKF